jgi:hypothetical protein
MKLSRATHLYFGLLLALLLPLQAFAALPNCAGADPHQGWHTAQSPSADHCDHAHPGAAHHDCGTCCSVAAAGHPLELWAAPPLTPPQPPAARIASPPSVAIDRLDRPPRFVLT